VNAFIIYQLLKEEFVPNLALYHGVTYSFLKKIIFLGYFVKVRPADIAKLLDFN
jgi:hypothetical protein